MQLLFCYFRWMCLAILGLLALSANADYSDHPDAMKLIEELVEEEGMDAAHIASVLAQAEKRQSIIDAMNRPAEKTLTWGQYRNIFMKDSRIDGGVDFLRENLEVLQQAEAEFGVPEEIIVAIIGVETLYGGNTGSYPVVDALATLAFDYPKRAPFFRSELKHFFILTSEQGQDPLSLKGSYAGAMGLGQFMPSSYRAYAKGYADDGFIDIWQDESDAIWSVANYISAHGWKAGLPVALSVDVADIFDSSVVSTELKPELTINQLVEAGVVVEHLQPGNSLATLMALQGQNGDEYWVGWQNFYVITRYNHSELYAMAVFQLAEAIGERR